MVFYLILCYILKRVTSLWGDKVTLMSNSSLHTVLLVSGRKEVIQKHRGNTNPADIL